MGIDLDGYTMLEVVEDVEAVRRALGYEKINLFSDSALVRRDGCGD